MINCTYWIFLGDKIYFVLFMTILMLPEDVR